MRETLLHSDEQLSVLLIVNDDGDGAQIVLKSEEDGPDLSFSDDVVLAINGKVQRFDDSTRHKASMILEDWTSYLEDGFSLMIRVEEFFDGWEFPPRFLD